MTADPASLDRLHDVIAPSAVPFWPPAPGWYWVIGILAVAALYGICAAFIAWQRAAYRREALAEWRACNELLPQPDRRAEAIRRLAVLVKRVALSIYPRDDVASLSGPRWSAFLDQRGAGPTLGERLEAPVYDPALAESLDSHQLQALSAEVRAWIHRDVKSKKASSDSQGSATRGVAPC